ncbi:T9SS type A sorting domain-containing protein [Flavobacterium sp.]|uniref:T9SS type A sorting domain-containing protein n=1 Tax=Flavobacterium sp. TaxID=239 RepID=UPI00286CE1F3|nr:T9SS type A sorting domain-containing protein [Flavobacterium sp.]
MKKIFYLILFIALNLQAQINVSTGVDASGNALAYGSTDPFWQISGGPLPTAVPAKVTQSLAVIWENTPILGTNANLINIEDTCCNSLTGIFYFERSFNVTAGTANLNCNFSVACDEYLYSFELVKPDATTIPINVVQSAIPFFLSTPVTDVISNPMAGTWKIKAKVLFLDNSGFFLLSGYINDHCQTLYVDADHDGYDHGTVTDCSGTVPSGYSLTSLGTDCDDSNPDVNPNHVEVVGNGIDDNCDGTIDEVYPTVKVIPQQCGTTLTSLWDTIFSTQYSGNGTATSYRFEISAPPFVRAFDTSGTPSQLYKCTMYNFPCVAFNTTYSVRVAVKVNGFWRAYGPTCTITTPLGLTTSLVPSSCGITVSSSWNSFFVNPVGSMPCFAVTGYRVKVVNVNTGVSSYLPLTVPGPTSFNLRNGAFVPPVILTPNNTYLISNQIELNNVWQAPGGVDLYGTTCVITTSPSFHKLSEPASEDMDFTVMAYPNPYNDNFNLDINTINESSIAVKIYDMMGRLIESRQLTASDLSTIAFGKNYASGVYNVIVTQGENVKTLRVIKR